MLSGCPILRIDNGPSKKHPLRRGAGSLKVLIGELLNEHYGKTHFYIFYKNIENFFYIYTPLIKIPILYTG
jgi:hypothetical protein